MDDEAREFVIRSLANIWTFNALFLSHLLRTLRENGCSEEALSDMLEQIDAEVGVLEGEDDQAYATGLLAVARQRMREER